MEKDLIRYLQADKPAPVCNYNANDAGPENKGCCYGVLRDGTPFAAELWQVEKCKVVSIFLPESHCVMDMSKFVTDKEQGAKVTDGWLTVLGKGMMEREANTQYNEEAWYGFYLKDYGIIDFKFNNPACRLHYLTDKASRDVVCIDVILSAGNTTWARTQLEFNPFNEKNGFEQEPQESMAKWN